MVFISKNKVRMHDTDMAGILYFARQFRFAHDAFEDLMASAHLNLHELFKNEPHIFVIVHAEADFHRSLFVTDNIEVHLNVEKIGTTSFTLLYKIFRVLDKNSNRELTGTAKTIHVCIDKNIRTKHPLPSFLIDLLKIHEDK